MKGIELEKVEDSNLNIVHVHSFLYKFLFIVNHQYTIERVYVFFVSASSNVIYWINCKYSNISNDSKLILQRR